MSRDRFHASPWPSLGVEIELQLVDARSMALTPAVDAILATTPGSIRDSVKPEFHRCCVEVNTGVCRDVAAVAADLGGKLGILERAARDAGIGLAWAGTHPFSHWREQPITSSPRYEALAGQYGETLRRQLTFGLHVHVGVRSGDEAVRACTGLRAHLPALVALSANSPFWCGRATGLMAHRIDVLATSPIGGIPPRVGVWDEYLRLVDRLAASGCIDSPKDLWWDVRPSPALGTVEVRVCDMPTGLPSVLALSALIQCLVFELSRRPGPDGPEDGCVALILQQNRWRAARHGLDAELVDLHDGRARPARAVIRDLTHRLRDTACRLGCAPALDRARAMAEGPNGAERQLATYARSGSLADVVRHLVPVPCAEGTPCPPEALDEQAPLGAPGPSATIPVASRTPCAVS
jgi:glutamate---cysteine ligase / carboxylate-amine ligase